jgi:hypothetical protein
MKIYYDARLSDFEAWCGAVYTLDRIKREHKINELEIILEELYPDGISDTKLNDLLWFDSDIVFGWLGIEKEE